MNETKARVCDAVDALREPLMEISRDLFEHPELKFEETRASQRLGKELAQAGFEVDVGIAGLETAIRAVHPAISGGPTVAIIAEYDALPELGHACGHNLIAAGALGAALALGRFKEDLPGTILLLGTPAEEGGGGKVTMVEAGLFEDVDAAMMFHPAPFTVTGWGSLAITEVAVAFRGVAAHASAWPEKGINALDAVLQTFHSINALRQHIKDGSRIHGIVTHGGAKPNIVPEYAAAEFYVRAPDTAYRDELLAKLRRCAEGAALATGASLEFSTIGHAYKAMKPNRMLGSAFRCNLEMLGWPIDEPSTSALGSTDMGDVSQAVPSIHPYIAIADPGVVGHTREFAQASASARGFEAMIVAAKAMAMTAVDVLVEKGLAEDAWTEFRSGPASR